MNLGPLEITLIVLVIFLLFGAKKLPELAQGIGKGMKEFRKALKENEEDADAEKSENNNSKKS